MHKKLLPPELLLLALHQIICRLELCPDPTGGTYSAPPDPLAGLGVGPQGKGKEGGEGRESRNAQIQSWQAY